jgi:hypothetical protein
MVDDLAGIVVGAMDERRLAASKDRQPKGI